MKNIKYLVIILILFIGVNIVYATDDNDIKLYDYALILNEKQEQKINNEIKKFIDNSNINLILITVRHPSKKDTTEYLNEFYNKHMYDDAILLVLYLNNNDVELNMRAFKNATKTYDEEQIKKILKNTKIKKSYYKTIINFIDEIESNDEYLANYNKYLDIKYWILILIPSIILASIITFIKILFNKNSKISNEENVYLKLDSLLVDKRTENFITTHTSKSRIR